MSTSQPSQPQQQQKSQQQQQNQYHGQTEGCVEAFKRTNIKTILYVMRGFNIINAGFLFVSCYMAFQIQDGVTQFFLSMYIGLAGLLLLTFELRFGALMRWIERQFGFMFTYSGRLLFLIFCGALNFGMYETSNEAGTQDREPQQSWNLGVGFATLGNALFNMFVLCYHPYFSRPRQEVGTKSDPKQLSEDEVMAYVRAHPEVAQRAANEATFSGAGAESPRRSQPKAVPLDSFGEQQERRNPAHASAAASPTASSPAAAASSGYQPPKPSSPKKQQTDDDNPFSSDNPFEN